MYVGLINYKHHVIVGPNVHIMPTRFLSIKYTLYEGVISCFNFLVYPPPPSLGRKPQIRPYVFRLQFLQNSRAQLG